MNKTTNAERQRLYDIAAQLLAAGYGQRAAEAHLQNTEGVSKERARHAVAKAILRRNKPRK